MLFLEGELAYCVLGGDDMEFDLYEVHLQPSIKAVVFMLGVLDIYLLQFLE